MGRLSESADFERENEETCLNRTTDNKSNHERLFAILRNVMVNRLIEE